MEAIGIYQEEPYKTQGKPLGGFRFAIKKGVFRAAWPRNRQWLAVRLNSDRHDGIPGVGVKYAGRVPMKAGDECEVEITGSGTLVNDIVGDASPDYRPE